MKKQWFVASLVTLASVGVLAACGSSGTKSAEKPAVTTEVTTETTTSSSVDKKEKKVASTTTFSSTKYADTDHMEFAINGKVYQLGETTLQTLIDDGVPFETDSLNNAGNNVNPNYESDTMKVVVGDYWNLQIWAVNFTDSAKPAKDLPITKIYFPFKKDKTQDVVTFNFPVDLSIDDLKANAGEPTENDHYEGDGGYTSDNMHYEYESSKYFSEGGYQFNFIKGVLDNVTITYIPR